MSHLPPVLEHRTLGSGQTCHPELMWEETIADRLTLISQIDWLYFEPAVFVQPGETFWIEDRTLHIRTDAGVVRRVTARESRPDDQR